MVRRRIVCRRRKLDSAYIRINQNYDKALPGKLETILANIDERKPPNIVVDLRLNGGGNYELTAPFAEALPDLLPDDGHLVLIIGHRTFSAAIVTAAILKARAGGRERPILRPCINGARGS